jgi:ABC-type lipoprotein export system ATPase subunit
LDPVTRDGRKINKMIRCENVDKVFRQGVKSLKAVDSAGIEVGPGERVYIHGPSGAGKSTFLHILGGLSRPTKGKVYAGKEDVYGMSDRKRSALRNRKFGFIFQFYHLLPELTVLENVMMPAMIKGGWPGRGMRKKAEDLIDAVGMTPRIKHRPGKLSGGEIQRCAIARALVNEPEFLFCDEPTGNLDSAMREEIYSIIKKLSEVRQMGVVLVSHQEVEKDFFDTEYLMKDGMLERISSPGRNPEDGVREDKYAKGTIWG